MSEENLPSIEERKVLTEKLKKSDWYKNRPKLVQEKFDEYPPYNTYQLNGKNVFLYSLDENKDGSVSTCTVNIVEEANPGGLLFGRRVFGVALSDLTDLGITEPWKGSK